MEEKFNAPKQLTPEEADKLKQELSKRNMATKIAEQEAGFQEQREEEAQKAIKETEEGMEELLKNK